MPGGETGITYKKYFLKSWKKFFSKFQKIDAGFFTRQQGDAGFLFRHFYEKKFFSMWCRALHPALHKNFWKFFKIFIKSNT